MKKLSSLLSALFLIFSLCSCGGKAAEEVTPANFLAALDAAIGKSPEEAEKLYLGKTVRANFLIVWINEDGELVMSSESYYAVPAEHTRLTARLSEEELATVKRGDVITLEGIVSGFSEYAPSKWSDQGKCTQVELSPAKLVGRTFQVSGEILQVDHLDPDFVSYVYGFKPNFLIVNSDEAFPKGQVTVYLEPGADYEVGQTVTATGTLWGGFRPGAAYYGYDPDMVSLYMDNPESIELEAP